MSERPTFFFRGFPVRAAGVLLYTWKGGYRYVLFRRLVHGYEDIGGKTDAGDRTFVDTAVREAVEETDGKLFDGNHTRQTCACILRELIETNSEVDYSVASKYVLFKLNVHPGILDMPMKRFGLQEKTDWGILEHYYVWLRTTPRKLHPRIRKLV